MQPPEFRVKVLDSRGSKARTHPTPLVYAPPPQKPCFRAWSTPTTRFQAPAGAQSYKRIVGEGKHGLTGGTLSVTRLQSPSGDPNSSAALHWHTSTPAAPPGADSDTPEGAPPGSGASEAQEATAGAGGRHGEVEGLGRVRRTLAGAAAHPGSRGSACERPFLSRTRHLPAAAAPHCRPQSSSQVLLSVRGNVGAHELVSVQPQEERPLQQAW